jgi:hypothetical protein
LQVSIYCAHVEFFPLGISEHKCDPADRIPDKIHVEMNPKTNAAWNLVQEMSFNPRLKLMLKPNRTLSTVISYLNQKWKSRRLRLVSLHCYMGEMTVATIMTNYSILVS